MNSNKAIFLHSPRIEQYSYPPDCPFRTERAAMARRTLVSMGLLSGPDREEVAPVAADWDAAGRFHTARYLKALREAEQGRPDVDGLAMGLGTPETPIFKGLCAYALLACGASLTAADWLLAGRARTAFNPSGGFHHADPEHAAGFCYLNDVALACLHLAEAGRRVLFLDVDVHHGDGVQRAFYQRRDVMTISMHESGETLFPGTGAVDEIGEGEGRGYCANVPLPAGTCDRLYLKAFREVVLPLIGAFDADVIVCEMGMDGLSGDPLAHLSLTNRVHAEIASRLLQFGRPLLMTGGGGYHAQNAARGWALVWSVLCGESSEHDAVGLGGVLLGSTDWQGGLKDRYLIPAPEQVRTVGPVVEAVIESVKRNVFPLHGL